MTSLPLRTLLLLFSLSAFFAILVNANRQLHGSCSVDSCMNGGRCQQLQNGDFHHCICDSAHFGDRCERAVCRQPCENGGVCTETSRDTFECLCQKGFSGPSCLTQLPSSCSRLLPCGSRGRCRLLDSPDPFTGRDFICECNLGWAGPDCRLAEPLCDGDGLPCRNGGRCVVSSGAMMCRCPSFFHGVLCESTDDVCTPNPCENGGSCRNTNSGFECVCQRGFSGENCTEHLSVRAVCKPSEDVPRLSSVGAASSFDPSAPLSLCLNGGFCTRARVCECAAGFSGQLCETKVDVCSASPCANVGMCMEDAQSSSGFSCICGPGFTGQRCQVDIDDCVSHLCAPGSLCIDGVASYECECPPGKTGIYCDEVDACFASPCVHGRCQPLLSPLDDSAPFECICEPGWDGQNCTSDVDECAGARDDICEAGGECVNEPGGFRCACPRGRAGRRCEMLIPVCSDGERCCAEVCMNGGYCDERGDCVCAEGWEGARCDNLTNSSLCISPSGVSHCLNGGLCQEWKSSDGAVKAECTCAKGFYGKRCENIEVPCTSSSCLNGGACDPSGLRCVCSSPFYGARCERSRDPCSGGSKCTNGGTCIAEAGSSNFSCVCAAGFEGEHCERPESACSSASPRCLNGGLCSSPSPGGFSCACSAGFTGTTCETNIDDCKIGSCLNGGSCRDGIDDFACDCSRGYTGKRCEVCVDVDVFNSTDRVDAAECKRAGCAALAGNGVCDAVCARVACGWDGGDCAAGHAAPFARCAAPAFCAHVFANGRCDEICNSEACLFDGFDCVAGGGQSRCPARIRDACSRRAADGRCDLDCNVEECGWDGGDCETATKRRNRTLSSSLVLILLVPPSEVVSRMPMLLLTLAEQLRASLRVRHTLEGLPEVFEWSSDSGADNRVLFREGTILSVKYEAKRSKRSPDSSTLHGVMIILEVDIADCRSDCFTETAAVASFIGAANTKKAFDQLGLPLHSAISSDQIPTKPSDESLAPWKSAVLCLAALFLVIFFVLLVAQQTVMRKRRVKTLVHRVWVPPTEQQNKESEMKGNFFRQPHFIHDFPMAKYARPNDYVGYHGYEALTPLDSLRSTTLDGAKYSSATSTTTTLSPSELYQPSYHISPLRPLPGCSSSSTLHYAPLQYPPRQQPPPQPEDSQLAKSLHGQGRVDGKIDPSLVNSPGSFGRTPLHWLALAPEAKTTADALADFEKLKNAGARLDDQDDDGNTALHNLMPSSRFAFVRRLLESGADAAVLNNQERDPLHLAAINCNDEMIEILLKEETVLKHVDSMDVEGKTALMYYAQHSLHSTRGAQLLLEAKADVLYAGDKHRQQFYRGATPLHWAAIGGNAQMATFLLERGANRDAQDVTDATPLWHAVRLRHLAVAKVLIDAGASLDFADQCDQTPADLAASLCPGDNELRRLLAAAKQRPPPSLAFGLLPPSAAAVDSRKAAEPKRRAVAVRRKPLNTPPESSSSSSGYSTTPSPPGAVIPGANSRGTVASVAAASSILDSPRSEQAGNGPRPPGTGNISSNFSSPTYATPNSLSHPADYGRPSSSAANSAPSVTSSSPPDSRPPLPQLHQMLPPAGANPSPPYDYGDYQQQQPLSGCGFGWAYARYGAPGHLSAAALPYAYEPYAPLPTISPCQFGAASQEK